VDLDPLGAIRGAAPSELKVGGDVVERPLYA